MPKFTTGKELRTLVTNPFFLYNPKSKSWGSDFLGRGEGRSGKSSTQETPENVPRTRPERMAELESHKQGLSASSRVPGKKQVYYARLVVTAHVPLHNRWGQRQRAALYKQSTAFFPSSHGVGSLQRITIHNTASPQGLTNTGYNYSFQSQQLREGLWVTLPANHY